MELVRFGLLQVLDGGMARGHLAAFRRYLLAQGHQEVPEIEQLDPAAFQNDTLAAFVQTLPDDE